MTKKASICLPLFLVLVFGGCLNYNKTPDQTNDLKYEVEKIKVFKGFKSENEETGEPVEEPFARIISVAVSDSTQNVYILDSDYKEVFVFEEAGEYLHSIKGGYGRGPGEFLFPREVFIDENEGVYVYDYTLRRVSLFSSSGELLNTLSTNVPSKSMLVSKNDIWFSILVSKKNQVVRRSLTEDSLQYYIQVNKRDLAFSPNGSNVRLGIGNNGQLVIASLIPGIWYKKVNDTFVQSGQDLLVEEEAEFTNDNIPVTPGVSMGIGGLFGNRIGIVWRELNVVDGSAKAGSFRLEIFEETGEHIETVELPVKWANDVFFDENNNIYFAVSDPVPSVEKYTVIELSN
ncbi:MAG: 6-bladed beta-propeller [Balneolaceae bacterium]|nr:6-bladed beta-propeller [Balneolaceae bacterium]